DNWVRARPIWNQQSYHVTNVNADGTVSAVPRLNWLTFGLNNFRQNAFPPDDPSRADTFTYTASDGALASETTTVYVDTLPPQNPPRITCGLPPVAYLGVPFQARVCADDPDGDEITFSAQ